MNDDAFNYHVVQFHMTLAVVEGAQAIEVLVACFKVPAELSAVGKPEHAAGQRSRAYASRSGAMIGVDGQPNGISPVRQRS
jgi:hypothetical protein